MAIMNEVRQIVRVTVWGLWLNLILVGLKLGVGVAVGSAALVADGVHSISDVSTDVICILGVRLSARPADESHAFGHGRYETIAALLIGGALVAAGVLITWRAAVSLYQGETNIPGYPVIVVAIVSLVSKEAMFRVTRRVAARTGSSALHVNAWHHRSDALSSVAVLIGAVAGAAGWGHGDQAAAIAVGIMVSAVGFGALRNVFVELTEGSISKEEQGEIVRAIRSIPDVRSWHRLRTRVVGREVFMDVHIRVDPEISVAEGHRICSNVEDAISRSLERPVNVVVHCEPQPQGRPSSERGRDG
jgi:cation diffusion facilitator family transporter